MRRSKKVFELGEIETIRSILRILKPVINRNACFPTEDDVQALDGCEIAVKIDGYSESMSRYPWESLRDWGWRAVTGPISDLSAKGYRAVGIVYSLGIPRNMELSTVKDLARGIREALHWYEASFLGGDLNSSRGEIWIDVAAIGKLSSGYPIPRNGANPGDKVFTTVQNGYGKPGLLYNLFVSGAWKKASRRLLSFRPAAVTSFSELARLIRIDSAIDSSDGLAKSLRLIAESSEISIELSRIPISNYMRKLLRKFSVDPLQATLFGGEEYEIIFTTSEPVERVIEACRAVGIRCLEIGRALRGDGKIFYKGKEILGEGWDHFRSGEDH
ncbi:MAG: thiamine-phosphate kinase [Fervidicoccaceae archaeon]